MNHIFNYNYLIEGIEATKADHFQFRDSYSSAKLEGPGGIAVITPINVTT